MSASPRTPAAERQRQDRDRQRRHRARRKHGRFVVSVELAEKHLDMLTAGGWLDDADADKTRACGAAIGRILDGLLARPSRVTSEGR